MFVAHSTLIECLRIVEPYKEKLQSETPEEILNAYEEQLRSLLSLKEAPKDHWLVILAWLLRLPEWEKAEKIRKGFEGVARQYGGTLTNLRWWNISCIRRHLATTIKRSDGTAIPVMFTWKKKRDAATEKRMPLPRAQKYSWSWDATIQNWRCDMEGETYYDVTPIFSDWLSKPLPAHLPNGTPFPYRRESSVSALNGHS